MPRRYPLPRPAKDPRFTFGLVLDVARLLAKHGYPDMTTPYAGVGGDLLALQAALFRFIYDREPSTAPNRGEVNR